MSWLPQQALLKHPKTRLFVTHAGVKSMVESICFKIPTVIVPFFADQMLNAIHMQEKLCGLILEKSDLSSTKKIVETMERVLTDDRFKIGVEKLSRFNQDVIMPQDKLASFWVEFALRHGQQIQRFTMRRGMSLDWIRYYNFDIFALCILFCLIIQQFSCIFLSCLRVFIQKLFHNINKYWLQNWSIFKIASKFGLTFKSPRKLKFMFTLYLPAKFSSWLTQLCIFILP